MHNPPEADLFAAALPAAPDLAEKLSAWLRGLAGERDLSPKTVEAYGRDVRQFLAFLTERNGAPPGIADFASITPAELRAFLARRRAEEVQSRSLMRALAGLRSFARFLERDSGARASAFFALRAPRIARSLPKPINPADARAMANAESRAGEEREPWILARDAAVIALLYGAGLRIAEALSIRRQDAPVDAVEMLTVIGKGRKQRTVPVIAPVRAAIEDYLKACPYVLKPDGPLFVGARGGDLRTIQELLGHSSLSTTQVYTAVDSARLLEAYRSAHPRARAQ